MGYKKIKKNILIFILLLNVSCGGNNENENDGLICTTMGSITGIKISFYEPLNIKAYLSYKVNDGQILEDECEPSDYPRLRKRGSFYETYVYGGDVLDFYFPRNKYEDLPTSNLINFKLYHRQTCSDPPELVLNYTGHLNWRADYVNGEHCGITGHTGTLEISD